jgi:septum formation protein
VEQPRLAADDYSAYASTVLYLASQSPQRAMLLKKAGIEFCVVPSTCDEETINAPHPQVLALERARGKAKAAVLPAGAMGVAVGADTVVALGMTVYGKPKDRADAVRILTALQGTTHTVYTGHCCFMTSDQQEAASIAMTKVTMRPMTSEEINAYVASGESDGRAGAYAIQETGDKYVVDMQGSWDTVVGLNIAVVARLYRQCTDAWPTGYKP